MPLKTLITDPIHPAGISILRNAGIEVKESPNITASDLEREIPNFDAVIVRGRTKITRKTLDAATKLRVIARAGVGLDNIDLAAAAERSIQVISAPEAPTVSVAELTLGFMLSVLRRIAYADRSMKEGLWPKNEIHGYELRCRTVGVLGAAGRIGYEVARIVKEGFKADVVGFDIVSLEKKASEVGFSVAESLRDLLTRSDIVTIHVPYNPGTRHLIDRDAINSMRPGSVLINTSRAEVVDGEALLKTLKEGKIAGAGLDVFYSEPPKDEWEIELVKMPNVVCTPHIGAQTIQCEELGSTTVAEEVVRILGLPSS